MEEFIENFNLFKDWLYNKYDADEDVTIYEVVSKFEDLKLDKVF